MSEISAARYFATAASAASLPIITARNLTTEREDFAVRCGFSDDDAVALAA
jgi:hypothetical protein